MTKTSIGLLFIFTGILYGSMAIDKFYNTTLGWLVRNSWIEPPKNPETGKTIFGRKPTILLYASGLILIGIYILWDP